MSRSRLQIIAAGMMMAGLVAGLIDWFPLRVPIVVIALLTAPGLAIAGLSAVKDPVVLLLLAVPTSLAVCGLIASAFVYLGAWNADAILASIGVVTLVASAQAAHRRATRGILIALAALPGLVLLAAALGRDFVEGRAAGTCRAPRPRFRLQPAAELTVAGSAARIWPAGLPRPSEVKGLLRPDGSITI